MMKTVTNDDDDDDDDDDDFENGAEEVQYLNHGTESFKAIPAAGANEYTDVDHCKGEPGEAL